MNYANCFQDRPKAGSKKFWKMILDMCPSGQTQPGCEVWPNTTQPVRSPRAVAGFTFFSTNLMQPWPKGYPWPPCPRQQPPESPAQRGQPATGLGQGGVNLFSSLTGQKPHKQTQKLDLGLVLACKTILGKAEVESAVTTMQPKRNPKVKAAPLFRVPCYSSWSWEPRK